MKSSYFGKVVYLKKEKAFYVTDVHGDCLVEELSIAKVYDNNNPDNFILDGIDETYRKQAEIWQVQVTVETKK